MPASFSIRIVSLALSFCILSTFSNAASTDWMKPSEAARFVNSQREQITVTKIECKDSGKPGKVEQMALARFHYGPKTGETEFAWALGDKRFHTRIAAQRKAQGFRPVSQSSFVRPSSGVGVYCTVWHR